MMQRQPKKMGSSEDNRGMIEDRRGRTLAEVIVVLAIVAVLVLAILMALPRGRESARMVGCQDNLRRFGFALALFDQSRGHLPEVAEAGKEGVAIPAALLGELGLADFSVLVDPKSRPKGSRPGPTPGPSRVPGFICASDPRATSDQFAAPISYRATTGGRTGGGDGIFAPGRRIAIADVEAADGADFTAAFSERLVGDGRSGSRSPRNYAVVAGPIGPDGCPPCPDSAYRGDAGSDWSASSWGFTIYNHARPPGASASCVANDGRTASVGASSGHVGRVHLLMIGGAVRPVALGVDPDVWRRLATVDDRGSSRPGSSPPEPRGP
jgi:prepilin-type N-terminal cleavage/methylation domain-containing protein